VLTACCGLVANCSSLASDVVIQDQSEDKDLLFSKRLTLAQYGTLQQRKEKLVAGSDTFASSASLAGKGGSSQ